MNKIKKLPTLLGIAVLLAGVAAGVWVIRTGIPSQLLQARPEITPKQIKVTNITDKGFTVSWVTDTPAGGFIRFGLGSELNLTAQDDRDEASQTTGEFVTHHVTLKNLQPATSYFFKIFSGKTEFANNGQPYDVTTAPASQQPLPENDVAYGTVLQADDTPAAGVIVYLSFSNATTQSTLTKNSGSWVIPLNYVRDSSLTSYLAYDREASIEEILAQGASAGIATAMTITKNDSPVPSLKLGETYDFREGLPATAAEDHHAAQEVSPLMAAKLKITNPEEKEMINTTQPQFWGLGPAGETITIEIRSDPIISGITTANANGAWYWSPPTNLTPGQHTITVSLADGQTISRLFTVLAAPDQPAFTASESATLPTLTPTPTVKLTPSASPTLTPTPTRTATATATPTITRVSQPSTAGGTPESGILTPTLVFSIMGSSLLIIGLLLVLSPQKNNHV